MALEKWVNAQLVLDGFFSTPWPSLTPTQTSAYALTAGVGSFTVAGTATSTLAGRKISCSFVEVLIQAPVGVTFDRTRAIVPVAGAFTVAGQIALLKVLRNIVPAAGAFIIAAGGAMAFNRSYIIVPSFGVFTLVTHPAGFWYGVAPLIADAGSVVLDGTAATLLAVRRLIAGSGSLAIYPQTVNLRAARNIIPGVGAYTIDGMSAGLWALRHLITLAGSFNVTGSAMTTGSARKISSAAGVITLSGMIAGLKHSLGVGHYLIAGGAAGLIHSSHLNIGSAAFNITAADEVYLGSKLGMIPNPGTVSILAGSPLTFGRTYIYRQSVPGSVLIVGQDWARFSTREAPWSPAPHTTLDRGSPSGITLRGGATSAPRRGSLSVLEERALSSLSTERTTPRVVAAAGVTIQYVDRYVYVDGSMTTATIFEMYFAWGDVATRQIFSLMSGAVIAEVNIWMLETFDGIGPVLTIGKSGAVDDLMNTTEVDPALLSSFSTRPGKEYSVGDIVNLYMTPGAGASRGRGVLSVYII